MSSVLCRVCVNPFRQSEMTKMFDDRNIPFPLAMMLSEIGGIEIPVEDEGLPKFCCQGCTRRLEDANELRELCQESDRKLRKMTKSVVKEEIDDVGGLLEQSMEEPVEPRELRSRNFASSIKTEEPESDFEYPMSDSDNVSDVEESDSNSDNDPLEQRGLRSRSSANHIKTKEIETKAKYPVSDDDRASGSEESDSKDDAKDPDFVEEEPKRKRTKKVTPKNISTGKSKRSSSSAKKLKADGDQSVDKPKKERKTQCSICGKTYKNSYICLEHEASHSQERPFKCHLCPKAYAFSNSLYHHMSLHDPNVIFKCDQCDKVYKNRESFRNHKSVHTGERSFQCTQCPKAYRLPSTLYQHVQQTHYRRKPFKCELCPKEFTTGYRLRLHREHKHEGQCVVCPHCGNKYHSRKYLEQHVAEKHPEHVENLSQCAFCGKGYTTISTYRKHVVREHPDRREEFEVLVKKD